MLKSLGLKDKLFPKKGKDKDVIITKAKSHIRKLAMMNKNYSKRAEISRKNAKIALQRGEKSRAKNYLIQYKNYQTKIDRTNNIRSKIERQIQAIEEGQLISQTGDLMGGMRDELKEIATTASPTRAAEINEDAELYVTEIEEAADILAGDPEIDLAIDVSEELEQLETEMLLEKGGEMPEVPSDELQYISEIDTEEVQPELQNKEKLQEEIEKLRKELEE
ncbi:MAG: Vps20/32/60-like protein (ESCRT-III) [Promethearchaeota archaeon]|nr:MAG: Vps20/32/60-like protein (ESCRT-III) [Candidatus Lokiarchaeota archaeon]